jgi:hypothetical protein
LFVPFVAALLSSLTNAQLILDTLCGFAMINSGRETTREIGRLGARFLAPAQIPQDAFRFRLDLAAKFVYDIDPVVSCRIIYGSAVR